jgi:UV DNA damage endonuclease
MNSGYACLTVGVPNTGQKSCRLKNASNSKLREIIKHNLNSLEKIIGYNIENNIRLFRISSDLIPFGSSNVNNLPWWDAYANELHTIGDKIINKGMRVSMHPGQYTVLNSPDSEVVRRAIEDLNYHAKVLNSLGVREEHKIVLHIGGIYNDKKRAIKRFISNYQYLYEEIKKRLIIENDDKSYNISEVLEIGAILNIPVVYDNLHNKANPCDPDKSEQYWINECRKTWQAKDGCQKIHYSQQNLFKKIGSHSETIRINEFIDFYRCLETYDLDIMLEVKDKNLSAIKCINCTSDNLTIKALEREWSKYKYTVLEKSPADYIKIRKLLRNKDNYPAISFYNLIEAALEKETIMGNSLNTAQHIWGYFKDIATNNEKNSFFKSMDKYSAGNGTSKTIKNILWKMAVKYQQTYLLDSYYFVL